MARRDTDGTPVKTGSRVSRVVYTVLLVFFAAVFIGSSGVLVHKLVIEPAQNKAVNDDLRNVFSQVIAETSEPEESVSVPESAALAQTQEPAPDPVIDPARRMEAVQRLSETVNSDIVGWITVDGTVIDYPVLQSAQNSPEYYLHRNYKDEYSAYGSIFLDSGHSTSGDLQVLYGHSMNDGSMFARLIQFGDAAMTAASPLIRYDTAEEASEWAIVSVFKANTRASQGTVFPYIRTGFSSPEDKLQYIYELMKRSMVDTHTTVNENDDLLLLSTCSYEFDDFRTVVVARRERDGETLSRAPDVTTAEHPLFPSCWYSRYGGSPYDWPEHFEDAFAADLTPWYDGGTSAE